MQEKNHAEFYCLLCNSALSKLVFFQLSNHISFFFFVKKCRCNSAKPKTYLAIICFFYSFFLPQIELTKLIRFYVHFCFIKKFAQFSFNDGMQETLRCFPWFIFMTCIHDLSAKNNYCVRISIFGLYIKFSLEIPLFPDFLFLIRTLAYEVDWEILFLHLDQL